MKEFLKLNWAFLLAVLIFSMMVGKMFVDRSDRKVNAEKHINLVMVTDKNCNDCHLGNSFVNLFSHNAVKGNDNIVNLIMDKTKIKRW